MIDREMNAQIDLGNQADKFMKSPLGQYVLGRLEQIIEAAKNKLVEVNPEDSKTVARLQSEIWKAGVVPAFLAELLAEGRQALNIIESTDDFMED